MMGNIYKGKLAKQLLISVLFISAIITGIMIFVDMFLDYKRQLDFADQGLRKVVMTSHDALTRSLWEINEDSLNVQLNALLRDSAIEGITITDAVIEMDEKFRISPEMQCDKREEYPLNFIHPITKEQLVLGNLVICESYQVIRENLLDRFLIVALLQFLKTLVMSGVILFIVHYLITKHLIRISGHMRTLSLGVEEEGIQLKLDRGRREDELTSLEFEINAMARRLRLSYESVRETAKCLDVQLKKTEAANLKVKMLSFAIENATDAVFIASVDDGQLHYQNQAFLEVVGCLQVAPDSKDINRILNELSSDWAKPQTHKALASKQCWKKKIEYSSVTGKRHPSMLLISQVGWQGGSFLIGFIHDLSEYHKLEEKYYHAQKISALGTMLGGVAHDFNNLLGVLMANQYLLKKCFTSEGAKGLKYLASMEQATEQSAQMIQKLMSFSRDIPSELKVYDCSKFVKNMLQMYMVSVPENVTVHQNSTGDVARVLGDKSQLQQAIINIMNNAVHATKGEDRPTLKFCMEVVKHGEYEVELENAHDSDLVHISISDNGMGMEREVLSKIFDPFFSLKAEGEGTGLGLATAFAAVESHHGLIQVESEVGLGTTFHIWLPICEKEEKEEEVFCEVGDSKQETVLLIEDNNLLRASVAAMLESKGYEVLEASDGEEGLSAFQANQDNIDIVVSDMVMPGMQGREVVDKIKQLDPQLKLIFVTGYNINHENESGDNDFPVVRKPVEVEVLHKTIQNILHG